MSLHLITGYAGQEHITAADHASFNMGVFGKGAFLFDRGNKFKAEIISNNLIRILDGDMMFQGRHVRLAENTYEELMIDNGTQGMKRFDLIVARYTKDVTTGVEKCEFAVLKGEENASTAVEPTRADGDISEDGNALITEVPIYRVELDGLNISKLQKKIYVKKLLENPIVPKNKSMKISKTGWYRIAKIECDSLSDARGGIGNNCNIEISRSFNALSTEFKKIQLVSINNSTKFTDETSSAVTNGQLIAKIRHTLDTATNTGYVEIYYSNDSTNNMLVTISNHMNYNGQYWELITPEETSETVDGVTVLGSHNFSLNYDVQTRLNPIESIFTNNPTFPTRPIVVNSGETKEFTFMYNRIYLLVIFNEYNAGRLYLLQTGGSLTTCSLTKIVSTGQDGFFTLTPHATDRTKLSIKAVNAIARVTSICIGTM